MTVVFTIGHSTRTIEEFIGLLEAHAVSRVVDVRTVPRSRHNPQFNQDFVARFIEESWPGLRSPARIGRASHAKRGSIRNAGWRTDSFRGYADDMQTPEFEENLEELIHLAKQEQIVIMCAEAVPWRCHRSLIADALLVRGVRTEDIMGRTRRTIHTLTPFAELRGKTLTYPAERS